VVVVAAAARGKAIRTFFEGIEIGVFRNSRKKIVFCAFHRPFVCYVI
jgi:hypothetical protein